MNHRIILLAAAAALAATAAAAQPWRVVASQGMRHAVLVDPALADDEAALRQVAQTTCPARSACLVDFYTDEASIPARGAPTGRQEQAVVARYARNPVMGTDRLVLHCRAGNAPCMK